MYWPAKFSPVFNLLLNAILIPQILLDKNVFNKNSQILLPVDSPRKAIQKEENKQHVIFSLDLLVGFRFGHHLSIFTSVVTSVGMLCWSVLNFVEKNQN